MTLDLDGIDIPAPTEEVFRRWERFLEDEVVFGLEGSGIHGKGHCARVLLYALLISRDMGMPSDWVEALCQACVFHDSRRQDDWYDVGHGDRAAEYYREYCAEKGMRFDERAYIAMRFHDRDDADGVRFMEGSGHADDTDVLLFKVLKDADGLDRFRLGPDQLDPSFLRTDESKALIPLSRRLNGIR